MKTLKLSILTLLLFCFFEESKAQVSAVMEARVEVISGVSFTSDVAPVINLSQTQADIQLIEAGSFSLVTIPGADIQISTSLNTFVKNAQGQTLEIDGLQVEELNAEAGTHRYSLNGTMKEHNRPEGHYEGMLTTVIEYL